MLAYLRLLDCSPSLAETPGELADPAARAWLEFGWTIATSICLLPIVGCRTTMSILVGVSEELEAD
eukprot:3386689-Amphidinium_carterae.1